MIGWHAITLLHLALLVMLLAGFSGAAHAGAQEPAPAASAASPRIEVASIKPSRAGDDDHNWNSGGNRVSVENFTLRRLIRTAYSLKSDSQVLGGPDWIGKQAFDLQAKFTDAEIAKMQKMNNHDRFQEVRVAVQELLADRFQLQISQETRTIPVYALVVAKSGAKFAPAAQQLDKNGQPRAEKNHSINDDNGHMTAKAVSMSGLANWFVYMPECDRVVVDRTGLSGEYDFKLDWTEDEGQGVPQNAPLPGLFTALHEQLGLELKPDKAPVDVVVVQSAMEPSEN